MTKPTAPRAQDRLEQAWLVRDSDPSAALDIVDTAVSETEEPTTHARAAVVRAFVRYRHGDLNVALSLILDAIEQLRRDNLSYWDGRASNTAALIYSGLGLPETAVEFLLKGEKQSLEIGDNRTAFSCFHNMGVELTQIGDYEGALASYERAETFAEHGDDAHAFLALNRCDLYLDKGDFALALETAAAGKQHWQETQSQARLFGLLVEARVALAANDAETAADALSTLRSEFDPERAGAELYLIEARVHLQRGELEEAERVLEANDLGEGSTTIEDVYLAARLVQVHAELAETRGDYKLALSIVRAAWTHESRERRQAMSKVTTLIMVENARQLEQKSLELEEQNRQLSEAMEELQLLHTQVQELVLRDQLTGLYNRRFLADHVYDLVKQHQRHDRNLSLLVFDVDNFKSINDTYLHTTGDAVLKQIASVLSTQKRAADLLCRTGGDEFVALLPDTDLDGARTMARRLHAAVHDHDWSEIAPGLEVSVSIGATTATSNHSLDDLLIAADAAMYGAKSAGKNQIALSA